MIVMIESIDHNYWEESLSSPGDDDKVEVHVRDSFKCGNRGVLQKSAEFFHFIICQ